jgi:hypothetical protein
MRATYFLAAFNLVAAAALLSGSVLTHDGVGHAQYLASSVIVLVLVGTALIAVRRAPRA